MKTIHISTQIRPDP